MSDIENRLSRLEQGHSEIQKDLQELTIQIKLLTQAMHQVPERLREVERNQDNTALVIKALVGLSVIVAGSSTAMIMSYLFGG